MLTHAAIWQLEVKQCSSSHSLVINRYRALKMSGGWSARGGQTQSAYVRGGVADDGIFDHSVCDWSSVCVRQCLIVLRIHLDRLQAQQ